MSMNKKTMSMKLVTFAVVASTAFLVGCITSSLPIDMNEELILCSPPVLSLFTYQHCWSVCAYNESAFGVKEVQWLNDTNVLITIYVGMNCAHHIGNGSIELINDALVLSYEEVGEEGVLFKCMFGYELHYLVQNIPRADYSIEILPVVLLS